MTREERRAELEAIWATYPEAPMPEVGISDVVPLDYEEAAAGMTENWGARMLEIGAEEGA